MHILIRLLAELIRMLIRFTFQLAALLLGCFVRLLYWSVRVYGWGRVLGFFAALTISGWVNFRILPAIGMFSVKGILIGVPLGTLIVWGIGWASFWGIGYAWQRATYNLQGRLNRNETNCLAPPGLNPAQTSTASAALTPAPPPVTIPTESGPLFQQVIHWENLLRAWQRVEANGGSAGPDGMTLEAFAMDWENQLRRLHEEIKTWRYRPQLPRWVEVPKQSGGMRRLAIFNVKDRIAQQLLNQVLLPTWDSRFAPCSYAYRPGRSAHQAVSAVEKALQNGRTWVVDADIESFFDRVPHQRLRKQLESWLNDQSVLALLLAMLTSASNDGLGLPQGSAISPLLSNLYLHSFDEALLQRGYAVHRYADDFLILCPTQQQAEEALTTSQRLLKAIQLRLNEQKTRIVHLNDGFTFLGFTFTAAGKSPSEEAVRSLNERIRNAKDETKLKQIENGWHAYFGESEMKELKNQKISNTQAVISPAGGLNSQQTKNKMPDHDFEEGFDEAELDDYPWFEETIISEPNNPPLVMQGGTLSDDDWNIYFKLFVGRKDIFAKHWQNEEGRCGYVPVRREITRSDVEAHLSGREIFGTYLLELDGCTKSLVFDVDGPTTDEAGRQKAHQLAMQMLLALDEQGIKPLLFDSGGKGRHLWLCFAEPAPAKTVRKWAQSFLDGFRPFPDGVMVEVFPKQDLISDNALGSMLRLPLGIHPQTSRFGSLLDESGQEVTNLWHILRTLKLTSPPPPSPQDCGEGLGVRSEIPPPPEAVAPIITGCSLLRGLVEKATRERNLKHTERLALLYTLGHCGDAGSSYIHQLIALCSNYDPRTTERFIQRLEQGHKAIRCSTLKEWLKDYLPGVCCECKIQKKNPSPLDLLSSSNSKKKTANQERKPAPSLSEQEWETIALDLFDFTEDE
jgi:group II intron reverse transcriptase/maturase